MPSGRTYLNPATASRFRTSGDSVPKRRTLRKPRCCFEAAAEATGSAIGFGEVAGGAERPQIRGMIGAAVCDRLDVVDVRGGPAAFGADRVGGEDGGADLPPRPR
jgi:hypothetical protein